MDLVLPGGYMPSSARAGPGGRTVGDLTGDWATAAFGRTLPDAEMDATLAELIQDRRARPLDG
jgi:hypothetical protein